MKRSTNLLLTSLFALFFLSTGVVFAGQAVQLTEPPVTATTMDSGDRTSVADWATMEEMAQTRFQKRMVRRLEKMEARHARKGKTHSGKSWLVALLLAIFLGYLGIDRFYLGYAGWGLIKLFTAGLAGILWVIDIILIALFILKPKHGSYGS